MSTEITIPSPGESITEVTLGPWHKSSGDWVEKDETLVEIESDKVTMEMPAPESGVLSIAADEGTEMNVGDVIGSIDTEAARPDGGGGQAGGAETDADGTERAGGGRGGEAVEAGSGTAAASTGTVSAPAAANETATSRAANGSTPRATSLARKIAEDRGVDLAGVPGTGPSGRIRKADVLAAGTVAPARERDGAASAEDQLPAVAGTRGVRRERMSRLRQRIAERLVQAQQTAAMLTTFNEADMSAVMALRKKHKETFQEKHGVGLGFMSFFARACTAALEAFPRVNASIVGDEIEFHDYVDLSVAVGTDKGLVVPVVRNVESMGFAEIEQAIRALAEKAREGSLSMEDMSGGTFTISNGGVYGSLNSTPILNPPQSGILGMHRIQNRPVEDPDNPGQITLRPMMYLALSYDHRIVDGAEAVGFLVAVRNAIEDPERLLLGI